MVENERNIPRGKKDGGMKKAREAEANISALGGKWQGKNE